MEAPKHVYEVYIRTTPERLWEAITSPEYTTRFFYGGKYESTWERDSPYRTILEDKTVPFIGTVLEYDPPRRLAYTFHYVGDPMTKLEQPSRVTWEIAPVPGRDFCKLTLLHDAFAPGETVTFRKVGGGWPLILSSLKSLIETGEPLPIEAVAIPE
jgi:uncharacterized protein YndB with AHSA1/START domain